MPKNAVLLQHKNEIYENGVVLIVIDELKLHYSGEEKAGKMHILWKLQINLQAHILQIFPHISECFASDQMYIGINLIV